MYIEQQNILLKKLQKKRPCVCVVIKYLSRVTDAFEILIFLMFTELTEWTGIAVDAQTSSWPPGVVAGVGPCEAWRLFCQSLTKVLMSDKGDSNNYVARVDGE